MNNRFHLSGIGAVSLMMVIAILLLTIFAILTLMTANNSYELTQNLAQSVNNYYKADKEATNILATIIQTAPTANNIPQSINGIAIFSSESNIIKYNCPIDDRQTLNVMIALNDKNHKIVLWQTEYIADWIIDNRIEVWNGE